MYLGDGVYAEEDHGQVRLSVLDSGERLKSVIYLEDSVAINLVDFLKKIGWINSSAEMGPEQERPKSHIDYEDI